jgi:endoglucanase
MTNTAEDARWNGQIIGQGGPQNDQFTSLWTQLATKYANQTKVIFGVMNEVSQPIDS